MIAATHNKGKLREFSRMLEHKEIEITTPPEGIMALSVTISRMVLFALFLRLLATGIILSL